MRHTVHLFVSLFLLAVAPGACGTVTSPIMDRISTAHLTRQKASRDLVAGAMAAQKCNGEKIQAVRVRGSGFDLTDDKGKVFKFTFTEVPSESLLPYPWFTDHFALPGCEICWSAKMGMGGPEEQLFMNALIFFQQQAKAHPVAYMDSAAFDKVLPGYRAMKDKEDLPEQARRYQVQAFNAVDEKRFEDAAESFQKALDVAPWWSQGYFNLAITLAGLGDFGAAVEAMNKYIKLEPAASDLRDAKDKIYEWEAK